MGERAWSAQGIARRRNGARPKADRRQGRAEPARRALGGSSGYLERVNLSLVWLACAAPPVAPASVVPSLSVTAPWRVERQTADSVWLRLGDTPDGVRVDLATSGTRVAGVSLIDGGYPREIEDGKTWPLVAVAEPGEPLSKAEIRVRGVDLEVHLAGRAIRARSTHPDAPMDPQLTWVRIRRRPDDWTVVVDGLAVGSLPGAGFEVGLADEGALALQTGWGEVSFATDAPATASTWSEARWALDLGPSIEALQPYPKTTLRISPSRRPR